MVGDSEPGLTADDLRRIVREVDPAAFVVPGRIVRRAIKHDRDLPSILFRVPHRLVYVISGEAVLKVVDRDELGLRADEVLPSTLILMAELEPDELEARPRAEVLKHYWRRLFHARVHIELDRRFADGLIDPVGVRERIRRIDPSAFEEARSVLKADDLLLPPRSDSSIYVEFAAVYLGHRAFSEHLIPRFFPAIRDYDAVDRAIAEDLDVEALLASTRLPGSAEPTPYLSEEEDEPEPEPDPDPEHEAPSGARYRRLLAKADRASGRGNLVRAAILRTQAARLAGPSLAGQARSQARKALDGLAGRLKAALEFDETSLREWRKVLVAPLERSSRGFWKAEARLLYDLQKVCVDHERPFFSVDLVEWVLSLRHRPIKRLLPHHQEVLMVQHLRGAVKHLTVARLPDADRGRFSRLLSEAVHHAEGRLRDRFRPEIGRALEETDFAARNLPERVALQKLNEELLDRVVHRGFLALGDLRDALSRNNRKLPDLSGPSEFLGGDRLLKADRRLSITMDGVYRRGEVYRRALQSFSALAFGTKIGRILTLYLVLPYGGAAMILEGLQHIVGPLIHLVFRTEVHLLTTWTFATVGTIAVFLIASRDFRTAFGRWLRRGYDLGRNVVVGIPMWILQQDWVRQILASPGCRFACRAVLVPLVASVVVWKLRPGYVNILQAETASGLIFLTTSLLLTTRAGRDLEEMAIDLLARAWSWFAFSLLPGLFRLVMEVFTRLLEAIERVLYTVDEWLRFRGGQGPLKFASKAVLGVVWFFVTYVVRFVVTLLIEPQVNPIKHFPVVTVSHKIMFTVVFLPLNRFMIGLFGDLGVVIAQTIMLLSPGVFGFLVWEFKENWRLYEANRATTLRPVVIGHHGETMARLLKPGFHSGTVPKLFAKLRRAERKALRTGQGKWVRKQLAHLHSVEEEVRHFIDRDFLTLLLQGRSMAGLPLALGGVIPGAKRFLIELDRAGRDCPGLWLSFEEHSGWLVAGIVDPGWLPDLAPAERNALATALAGLYKMAGVDLVREPIVDALGPDSPSYDFREEGLVVWPDDATSTEILYLLRPAPGVPPLVTIDGSGHPAIADPPRLATDRLLFASMDVAWKRWVEVWEDDRAGQDPPAEFVPGLKLLPNLPQASEVGKEPGSPSPA